MIREIPMPAISPSFTVADIHKIREWDYERLRDATPEERSADIELRADEMRRAIAEIRQAKAMRVANSKAAPHKERVTAMAMDFRAGQGQKRRNSSAISSIVDADPA